MNRTKVTVACKACQKKKVKCTGISPCTNCIRAGQRCEFTGTAKKRGPRNGNVEVIKSPARRIENVLQENPNLRGQIEQMLAHGNTRPAVRSARPHPIIPSNAPIVIIDDDTGVTTDASQSHGIPRSISYGPHDAYPHDNNVSMEPQTFHSHSPVLRKPIPVYPVTMQRSHVTAAQRSDTPPNNSNTQLGTNKTNLVSLPPISELETLSQQDVQNTNGLIFTTLSSSPSRMTLPTPNRVTRKKASMPINLSSGIEILLPAAPDIANPLDSATMLINNQHPIKLPPLDLPVHDKLSPFTPSLPSPPASQSFDSPKSMSFKYKEFCNPPTPTNSSPPSSPTNSILSRSMEWENNPYCTFSRKGDDMEIDRTAY